MRETYLRNGRAITPLRGIAGLVPFMDDGMIFNNGVAALGRIAQHEPGNDSALAIVLTHARNYIFIRHAKLAQIARAAEAVASSAVTEGDFTTSPFAKLGAMLRCGDRPVIDVAFR